MPVSLQIFGMDNVKKLMNKIDGRIKDDTEAMRLIGVMGEKITALHFINEEGPSGKWQALKKSTIARRRKGSGRILQDTGTLKGSTQSTARNHEAVVFNSASYGIYHNSDAPRTRLPQRKFLWFSAIDVLNFSKTYLKRIFS